MNTTSEETREDGNQRRKSIGSGGGHGGGLTVSGGKSRRYSIGITSSRKSVGEEGNVVPNYLRASTGSCHDFCKYGKKHEHSKSAIPVKFKRSTVVNKEKFTKTVVPVERKKTTTNPKTQTPVESTKKDVPISLPSKKTEVLKRGLSTNGKPKDNELKMGQRSTSVVKPSFGSNGGIKKKDIKTVKKTGVTPKDVKKVVVKGTTVESQSPKASSFSRGASLKVIKHRNDKQVSPLKDQNIMQKVEVKQTEAESEAKSETMEFDYIHGTVEIVHSPSFVIKELINDSVSRNGLEKESVITHSVYESSKLFPEQEPVEDSSMAGILEKSQSFSEVLEEDSLIAPPVSESSQSYYDDEVLEDESEFTDEEEESQSNENEKVNATENNEKILRKGRMVISEEKDDEGVKLRFRRGKIIDLQSDNNGPRRLKFRKGKVIEGNEDRQHISRRSFEKKYEKETNDDSNDGHESVVLKHQGEQGKKDAQGLYNNVIEETASKLVESRKSKVKALVGAFETVISLQDGKPSST